MVTTRQEWYRQGWSDDESDWDNESQASSNPGGPVFLNWFLGEPDTPTRTTIQYFAWVYNEISPGLWGSSAALGPYDNIFGLNSALRDVVRNFTEPGAIVRTGTIWHGFEGTHPQMLACPICG